MQIVAADHPLTDDEIRDRFGPLIRAGVEEFRRDVNYLVAVAESWANDNRKRTPETPEERDVRMAENYAKRVLTTELREKQAVILRQRFDEGATGAAVAAELLMQESTVHSRWRRMGLRAADRPRRDLPGRTPSPVVERREEAVRAHFEQGLNQRESAELLNVTPGGVSQIRKRLGIG